MSASSKKKLRKEQETAKLTEKQLSAQSEARKVNLYTTAFVVVMSLILVVAVTVGISQFISNSGIRERNTTALTVGESKLSNADLNYFYVDTVNNFYSQNSSYISLFGIDTSLPLDEQMFNEETGETWADYFLDYAVNTATNVYALANAAKAEGFTLPEDEAAQVESVMSTYGIYANLMGYTKSEDYIKAMYGRGATEKGVRNYLEMSMLADAYDASYQENLTYTDEQLRAAEAENYDLYSSFTYNYYYLTASRFQEGGTTDEEGVTTYSEEETAAALAAAEAAAQSIADAQITSIDELDAAIAALSINADSTSAKSSAYEDYAYGSIDTDISAWLTESGRKAGDIAAIANTSTTTAEDGTETTEILGYYVVYFLNKNDNAFALKNIRHILAGFEGGTTDDSGTTVYSDEEKAAARTAAEEILSQWKAGNATEDSFAELAVEKSTDTGSAAGGGLYEDVYPGQMVDPFEEWCFDEARKPGDTGIVETTYGYHVMYFVGNSDVTYRDYQIRDDLSNKDHTAWSNALIDALTVTEGNTKYLSTDLVLGNFS